MFELTLKSHHLRRLDIVPRRYGQSDEVSRQRDYDPDMLVSIETSDLLNSSITTTYTVQRGSGETWDAIETASEMIYLIAGGKVWRLDPLTKRSEYCNIDDALGLIETPCGTVIVARCTCCICLESNQVLWTTGTLSYDGLERMYVKDLNVHMSGWHSPSDSWKPVVISFKGEVLQSAYP